MRNLLFMFILFFSISAYTGNGIKAEELIESTIDNTSLWPDKLIDAIITVESGGNPRAIGGSSVGILQITPIAVRECNNILKAKGSKKRYTYNDRYDIKKSKEMFMLIQEKYNPERNIEKAIRLWNGGPGYTIRGTQKYLNKVMKILKKG